MPPLPAAAVTGLCAAAICPGGRIMSCGSCLLELSVALCLLHTDLFNSLLCYWVVNNIDMFALLFLILFLLNWFTPLVAGLAVSFLLYCFSVVEYSCF
jgi:hypothetical protein